MLLLLATRPHDYGFEKATEAKTVRVRHHARVWRTGYVTEAGALFVGTVSLDPGMTRPSQVPDAQPAPASAIAVSAGKISQ